MTINLSLKFHHNSINLLGYYYLIIYFNITIIIYVVCNLQLIGAEPRKVYQLLLSNYIVTNIAYNVFY